MGEIIIQGATLGLCIYLTIWTVVCFKGELDSSFSQHVFRYALDRNFRVNDAIENVKRELEKRCEEHTKGTDYKVGDVLTVEGKNYRIVEIVNTSAEGDVRTITITADGVTI